MKENTGPEESGPMGKAKIRFPSLPQAALAKTSTTLFPVMPYYFTLIIEGEGMGSITKTWNLTEVSGQSMVIDNIPSGYNRVFTGQILFANSITHQGSYSINVTGGDTVFVPLVLRDIRNGHAEICVEVEGWPNNPNCTFIDTLPIDTIPVEPIDTLPAKYFSILGCWNLNLFIPGLTQTGTANFRGNDGFIYSNTNISGNFSSSNGDSYNISGYWQDGGWNLTLAKEYLVQTIPAPYSYNNLDSTRFGHHELRDISPIYHQTINQYLRITSATESDDSWKISQPSPSVDSGWACIMKPYFKRALIGLVMDESFTKVMGKMSGEDSPCTYYTPGLIDDSVTFITK